MICKICDNKYNGKDELTKKYMKIEESLHVLCLLFHKPKEVVKLSRRICLTCMEKIHKKLYTLIMEEIT